MKKILGTLMLLCVMPCTVSAETPNGWNKLTKVQQAAMTLDIAQKTANTSVIPKQIVDVLSTQGIGKTIGKEIVDLSREIGVGVSEFLHTPIGVLTASVIVWKIIGKDIMHIVGGIVFMVTSLVCLWRIYVRMCIVKSVETKVVDGGWFGKKTVKIETRYNDHEITTDTHLAYTLVAVCITIVGVVMIFSY